MEAFKKSVKCKNITLFLMNGLFVIVTVNLLLICDIFRLSVWASQRAAAMGEYSSENSEEKVLRRKQINISEVMWSIYRYYVNWGKFLLTGILPISALIYFNTCIYKKIKWVPLQNINQEDIFFFFSRYAHRRSHRTNSCIHNEMNLSLVLICIVMVFIVCHIPRILVNCAEFFLSESIMK